MDLIQIELSETLREFLEEQIASGRHRTPSDYVEALIREDRRRKAEERLEALLLEGLEGQGTPATDEWWDQFRARHASPIRPRDRSTG